MQKRRLDEARRHGDELNIELIEDGMNNLLEHLLQVTNK